MQVLRSFILCIVLGVLLFGSTTAVPQWQNSTDGRQYLIEGDQKYNWFHAFHECARRNLQLVEIDSQQKNQALIAVLKPLFGNSHNLWLGANDEFSQDKNYKRPFYWSSSGKPMTFSHWSANNPDNDRHGEHCVHMWVHKPEYQWNDIHCDSPRFGFICEDHHLHAGHHKTLAEKQQKITETNAKLFKEYSQQQNQKIEQLETSLKEIESGETELKELLHNIHTKLEFDITHALAQHQREVNSVVQDRNKAIRNQNAYLRSATEVMTKKFTKELEAAKSVYNDILKE